MSPVKVFVATLVGAAVFASAFVACDELEVDDYADEPLALFEPYDESRAMVDDDSTAVFPPPGDPVWGGERKLVASDGEAVDRFGISVSICGDTAVVGSLNDDENGEDSGAAYVFTRTGSFWTQETKLVASDGEAEDHLGSAVSISGNTAVVAALPDDAAGASSGSVYVFTRSGTAWTQEQKLNADDAEAYDRFGTSVAIDGDTIIVGASFDDDNGADSGAAYVFTRTGTMWVQEQKLYADDGDSFDYFGASVAVDGDTAIVGADWADAGAVNSGAAYVFKRSGTTWTVEQKLTADDAEANDRLGTAVALDGDTAVVGADGDDDTEDDSGSAYVFTRSGSSWNQEAKLLAGDGEADAKFGCSIDVDGDTALVGAYGEDGDVANSGAAYVFTRSGTAWSQAHKLTASDGGIGDYFGRSVSIDRDTAVTGADNHDDGGSNVGAAYVFTYRGDDGQDCSVDADCNSGYCVDDVCCDTACGDGTTDDCRACSAAAGASNDGVCEDLNGTPCDDGDDTTFDDVCIDGACEGTSDTDTDADADTDANAGSDDGTAGGCGCSAIGKGEPNILPALFEAIFPSGVEWRIYL